MTQTYICGNSPAVGDVVEYRDGTRLVIPRYSLAVDAKDLPRSIHNPSHSSWWVFAPEHFRLLRRAEPVTGGNPS